MKAQHTCQECGHRWDCLEPRHPRCGIETAARANKTGPFCGLCRHLEMARRFAFLRGIRLTIRQVKLRRLPGVRYRVSYPTHGKLGRLPEE